mmetsp:Transcript_15354/g.14725  ORF Transcript_15354/g.14725 Transcript_15354/m.14725 type:complete len:113 (-) Transcript_15354:795-1133(-)
MVAVGDIMIWNSTTRYVLLCKSNREEPNITQSKNIEKNNPPPMTRAILRRLDTVLMSAVLMEPLFKCTPNSPIRKPREWPNITPKERHRNPNPMLYIWPILSSLDGYNRPIH